MTVSLTTIGNRVVCELVLVIVLTRVATEAANSGRTTRSSTCSGRNTDEPELASVVRVMMGTPFGHMRESG